MKIHRRNVVMTLAVPSSPSFLATDIRNVDLFPASTELTVAQAAVLLDVPEGYIEELLDDDLIEYRPEGTQRLVNRDGLLEYKKERERRHALLDEMVRLD